MKQGFPSKEEPHQIFDDIIVEINECPRTKTSGLIQATFTKPTSTAFTSPTLAFGPDLVLAFIVVILN